MSKMPKEMGHAYSSLQKTFQVELDRGVNKTEIPESTWVLLGEMNGFNHFTWTASCGSQSMLERYSLQA